MRKARRLFVLAALFLSLGCSDETQINSVGTDDLSYHPGPFEATPKATLSDRSEWVYLDTYVYNYGDFSLPIPCANDNQGEEMWHVATYNLYAKWVTTPSGRYLQVARFDMEEGSGWVGITSGDVWEVEKFLEPYALITRGTDDTWQVAPLVEIYENQDGDRIKSTTLYKILTDPSGTPIIEDIDVLNCNWLGRQ